MPDEQSKPKVVKYVSMPFDDYVELEMMGQEVEALRPLFERLTDLVQNNQDFFGDPPAGTHAPTLAVNKLEDLVEFYNLKQERDRERYNTPGQARADSARGI